MGKLAEQVVNTVMWEAPFPTLVVHHSGAGRRPADLLFCSQGRLTAVDFTVITPVRDATVALKEREPELLHSCGMELPSVCGSLLARFGSTGPLTPGALSTGRSLWPCGSTAHSLDYWPVPLRACRTGLAKTQLLGPQLLG